MTRPDRTAAVARRTRSAVTFAGRPAGGYVAPTHVSTAANSAGATTWDPPGYRETYRRVWGR